MKHAKVTLEMGSPIAVGDFGLPTADAPLFGQAVRRIYPNASDRRDPREWTEIPLPIAKSDDGTFYRASQLIATQQIRPKRIVGFKRSSVEVTPVNQQGSTELRAASYTFYTYPFRKLYFYVDFHEDQRDELVDLLQAIPGSFIGTHTSSGYGRVLSLNAELTERASSIMDASRHALRPIPQAYAEEHGITGNLSFGSILPPYKHTPPQNVVVPTLAPYFIEEDLQ